MKLYKRHGCILAPPLPNSFAGLMEMYEANYIKIRKLCGTTRSLPPVAVSRISKGMDLYLQVLENTKYTSTLILTYYFTEPDLGFHAYPNLKLRIYYDALQAEVMSQAYRRQDPDFQAFNHASSPSLLKKWRMNRFLYKWLSFCNRQGHSFQTDNPHRQNLILTENVVIPLQGSMTSSTIVK